MQFSRIMTLSVLATAAASSAKSIANHEKFSLTSPKHVGLVHTDVFEQLGQKYAHTGRPKDKEEMMKDVAEIVASYCPLDHEYCVAKTHEINHNTLQKYNHYNSNNNNSNSYYYFSDTEEALDTLFPNDFDKQLLTYMGDMFNTLDELENNGAMMDADDVVNRLHEIEHDIEQMEIDNVNVNIADSDNKNSLFEEHRHVALSAIAVAIESSLLWTEVYGDISHPLHNLHYPSYYDNNNNNDNGRALYSGKDDDLYDDTLYDDNVADIIKADVAGSIYGTAPNINQGYSWQQMVVMGLITSVPESAAWAQNPPTSSPTVSPSISNNPTSSRLPTAMPSITPTGIPTSIPSSMPSYEPVTWTLTHTTDTSMASNVPRGSQVTMSYSGTVAVLSGPRTLFIHNYDASTYSWSSTTDLSDSFIAKTTAALNYDGTRLVVGDAHPVGSFSTFDYNSFTGTWTQLGAAIYGGILSDGSSGMKLGASVDLNYSGDRLIVGGPAASLVHVYDMSLSNIWMLSQTLTGETSFGTTVSLSGDGDRIVVAAPWALAKEMGYVEIYENTAVSTTATAPAPNFEQTQRIQGKDKDDMYYVGSSMAVSKDGTTIAIGFYATSTVDIYQVDPFKYNETQKLDYKKVKDIKLKEKNVKAYGWNLALDDEATRIAVTSLYSDTSKTGKTNVYAIDQLFDRPIGELSGMQPDAFAGENVALSGDGYIMAVNHVNPLSSTFSNHLKVYDSNNYY